MALLKMSSSHPKANTATPGGRSFVMLTAANSGETVHVRLGQGLVVHLIGKSGRIGVYPPSDSVVRQERTDRIGTTPSDIMYYFKAVGPGRVELLRTSTCPIGACPQPFDATVIVDH